MAKVEMEHLEEISGRITAEDFVCVMTHGHRHDHAVVSQVLRTPAAYIGVIGSAKKAAASREKLQQEGFGPGDLARIVTPIGLAIGLKRRRRLPSASWPSSLRNGPSCGQERCVERAIEGKMPRGKGASLQPRKKPFARSKEL